MAMCVCACHVLLGNPLSSLDNPCGGKHLRAFVLADADSITPFRIGIITSVHCGVVLTSVHVQIHEGCRRFPTIVEFTARILIQPSSDSLTLTFPLKVDINEQKGNFDSSYTHVRPYM